MVWVKVDWSDGVYTMRLSDRAHEVGVIDGIVAVSDELWARYQEHCADARFWADVLRHIDNGRR